VSSYPIACLPNQIEPVLAEPDAGWVAEQTKRIGGMSESFEFRPTQVFIRQHQLLSMEDRRVQRVLVGPVRKSSSTDVNLPAFG
jgi:CBS domain containing-hemolysin-like protein